MIACAGIGWSRACLERFNGNSGWGNRCSTIDRSWSVEFDATGSRVVTASTDGRAIIWNPRTGERVGPAVEARRSGHGMRVSVEMGADLRRRLKTQPHVFGALRPVNLLLLHFGTSEACDYVELSPNGSLVATASYDGIARLWDISTGQPIGGPMHHTQSVWSARFSPDGNWLLTCSDDFSAKIWNVANWRSGLRASSP